jgi:hypothetical protein
MANDSVLAPRTVRQMQSIRMWRQNSCDARRTDGIDRAILVDLVCRLPARKVEEARFATLRQRLYVRYLL